MFFWLGSWRRLYRAQSINFANIFTLAGTTKASPFDITSSPPPSAQVQVPASQATTQDKTGKPLSPQYYAPKNYRADDDYKSGSSDDDDMLETQRPLSENAIIQSIETQQWEREKAGYESYRRQ